MKKILITIALIILIIPPFVFAAGYCGDGVLDTAGGEECDDGNFTNRDGCDSYCKIEDMTPPTVESVSIEEGATDVSAILNKIIVSFSEPVDQATLNEDTIQLKQYTTVLETELDLSDDGKTVTVMIKEDLVGNKEHSLVVKDVKDIAGNQMAEIHVTSFTAGESIDHTPPEIVVKPKGGTYSLAQSITLTAYEEELPYYGEEYIDENAKIYYTTDGSTPDSGSTKYEKAISISKDTTLKYFGIDQSGNHSTIITQNYKFDCAEKENATSVTSYPECKVEECEPGFLLKSNVCVINLGTIDEDDYKTNAATAPLFGSSTPMTISTKPALYITPEHKGLIPRPIHFKDTVRGTIIDFERNTTIRNGNNELFSGYIKPPDNLYSKDFPINFGYTFKSIFAFQPVEEDRLYFSPAYKITIPFTERFDPDEDVTIFTYNSDTEEYTKYSEDLVSVNVEEETVTITADRTNNFFVAQPGKNYNKAEFKDCIGHWAQNYAEELYRKGIVKGKDKGVYAPDDNLTRAEFTKIALNAIGEEVNPMENVEKAPFRDVALYAWYVPYVKRAKEVGLINGYPDGSFKPDQAINRAEAITILMRAFDFDLLSAGGRTDSYTDVLTDQWYFPAVNFSIKNKFIDGIRLPSGKIMTTDFGPGRPITRAEMAKLAVKAMELNEDNE